MRTLVISGLTVDLDCSDRDFVSITGVEKTRIGPFFIQGNRHALVIENPDLANTWLAGDIAVVNQQVVRIPTDLYIENDMDDFKFVLPGRISQWSGWAAYGKVKRRGLDGHGADLTDEEIDLLSYLTPDDVR